jgi:hypothetical protein
VAIVRVARQRLGVAMKLAAPGAIERCGERDLDAELIRTMGLALADAFDPTRQTPLSCKGNDSPIPGNTLKIRRLRIVDGLRGNVLLR